MFLKMGKYNLLQRILENAIWRGKDAFPSDDIWANEVESWLRYIDFKGQFDRFFSRLTKQDAKKRDEALAEISSSYFLEKICSFRIIEWEPIGVNNGVGEFMLSLNSVSIFCEVKSPGWELEVIKEHGIRAKRLDLPKHINGEVKGVDNSTYIRDAIDRAYKKFPEDKPSLLIFSDDLWFSPLDEVTISFGGMELPLSIYRALYREPLLPPYTDEKPEGCFNTKQYEKLSGVLFLKVINNGEIIYKNKIYENNNAVNRLPKEIFELENISQLKYKWTKNSKT